MKTPKRIVNQIPPLVRWLAPLLFAAVALGGPARAATVLETSVAEMLENSALVVEGEVVQIAPSTSAQATASGYPWTAVTVRITDVIKRSPGSADTGDTVVLNFLGGKQRRGRSVSVPGMRLPGMGEQGVFFIEEPTRMQPHPLFGWSQGQFPFHTDDAGVSRVVTAKGKPVTGVSRTVRRTTRAITNGTAEGVATATTMDRGLRPDEFKRQLRELLR